ncbi:hypothetical protein AU255_17715 [Methyloprofundus sedimenti]|uniref:VWFA domain-containing protein n=2 Tax=Methyloprofundus sedimenti TaxID=1420851 RepID=A0A1V8M164_9GAMM|nr:VWA domain-containing protein [Methyloprofundus sedimenti]OQK15310.1 hypothetical protein AU255_17715 [Methyloprofundus sedimenti]
MMLNEFHFIRPYWLLALLPLLVFIFLSFKNKLQQGSWQAVCDTDLLPFILQEKPAKQSRMPLFASSLAALLTILALAGPTWERIPTPVFRNAAALVIVLDLSRSMEAGDIKPSRLARARYKISDLLNKRKDGQTALIVYAASAFTVTPLTDDTETINSQLSALTGDIMPAQGSNSLVALQLAIQLFKNAGLQKGQILLITDDDKIEQAIDQAELPSAFQLSILGVGTQGGAPIKLAQGGFLKDASGNIVLAKLNSRALQKAAQNSGGIYQQITDTDADIERLSHYFDQTAKHSAALNNDLLLENWLEAGVWLMLPVLLLSALSFRRGLLTLLFIFLLPLPKNSYAFEWQDLWQTKQQQAQQEYLNGNYQQAAEQFTDPAWQAAARYKADQKLSEDEQMLPATTDTGYYNQGNVLAKSGQLEQAISAYDEALKLNPDNEDARYNKELVEKALEEEQQKQQQQDQDKNQQQQQDQKEQQEDQSGDQQDQQEQQKNQSGDQQDQQDQQDGQSEEQSEQQKPKSSADADDNKPQDPAAETEQEQNKESEQQQNAEARKQENAEQEQEKEPEATQASEENVQDSEQQQASEQWLKRIPDDPSGLLKRKFKYQYGQQKQQQNSGQQW